MNPIEIPDIEDERLFISFALPVKNRKPLSFKLPRLDFIPPEDFKTLMWLMAELDVDIEKLKELVDITEVGVAEKAAVLIMLKPHVSAAQFKVLQKTSLGQLKFIQQEWNRVSTTSVGEYLASAVSLRSTEGPSSTTSSDTDTDTSTSDGDSDGENSEPS